MNHKEYNLFKSQYTDIWLTSLDTVLLMQNARQDGCKTAKFGLDLTHIRIPSLLPFYYVRG